eukprot:4145750-Amphidinium_carterae.1
MVPSVRRTHSDGICLWLRGASVLSTCSCGSTASLTQSQMLTVVLKMRHLFMSCSLQCSLRVECNGNCRKVDVRYAEGVKFEV